MTEHAPGSGDVDMIRPTGAEISDEVSSEMVFDAGEPEGADGPLADPNLTGVGSLSEILGVDERCHRDVVDVFQDVGA